MSLAIACLMPFVMLALVFLLERIESRHLTERTRVEGTPAQGDLVLGGDGAATSPA